MTRTIIAALSLLLAANQVVAQATPTPTVGPRVQLKYNVQPASVARLSAESNGIEIVANLLPSATVCGVDRCNEIPLPARGVAQSYTVRAYNSLGESAASNAVGFLAPFIPNAPTLQVQVVVP